MRFRFEPAIFSSAPLDKRDWRWHLTSAFSQCLRKYTSTGVHTKTHKLRFQIYPLWRAFSNLCVYGERFHRLRVDGRPKCIKKFAFSGVCVYNRLRVDGASVKVTTCSFQHGLRTSHVFTPLHNVHSRHTPLRVNFFRFYGQVKGWDIFPRWKIFLLVSYFYVWAKPSRSLIGQEQVKFVPPLTGQCFENL